MAMFVLVVDTSLMNVSISAVVRDLHTTVSGVQGAIALEALVSAAFILIGGKTGDLIGRKLAYILGLLGYAVGAIAMTLAQNLTAIIIFWAVIGGIGASLLLPSMQSLIHGNFEGEYQKRVYALVGASAAIAATPMAISTSTNSPPSCHTRMPVTIPPIPITDSSAPTRSIERDPV
jgi:MFS family permease